MTTLFFLYLFLAIGISFLCSIMEAVLLSVNQGHIEKINSKNPRSGAKLQQTKDDIEESLSAILILNTFAHTMGAAGVGSQALQIFGPEWETLIAISLTLTILYLSEIIPKTLGATYWRQLSIPAAYTISMLIKLVYPLVWISNHVTKLLNLKKNDEITREEIQALATLGYRHGALIHQESQYLDNLLKFREIRVKDILTPRTVVHALDQSLSVTDALNHPSTAEFSRIPIYQKDIDAITAKVIRSNLYVAERNGKGQEPISNFSKPIFKVSEKLPVQNALDLFIKRQEHLFLVEDEFGQTAGIVTLEDTIETLLGREIVDESDSVEDMQALAKSRFRKKLKESKGIYLEDKDI